MYTHTLSLIMALASPPEFGERLDRVEVEEYGDAAEIVALDSAGTPIGVISVWADSGVIHVDSDYDDGYLHIVIANGESSIDSTLDPDVAGNRSGDGESLGYRWGDCDRV